MNILIAVAFYMHI